MTREGGHDSERRTRKELVTLSVIAGSAISLAATWLGIAAADARAVAVSASSAGAERAPLEAVQGAVPARVVTSEAPSTSPAPPLPSAGTLLVPAPQPPVQVRPVRRSRAS